MLTPVNPILVNCVAPMRRRAVCMVMVTNPAADHRSASDHVGGLSTELELRTPDRRHKIISSAVDA